MNSKAQILVTGATGFVGKHLVERMQQLELPVTALWKIKAYRFPRLFYPGRFN